MRILVSFEDDYRAYGEVIAAAIRILRPHAEVGTTAPMRLRRKQRDLSRRWLSAVDPAQRTRTTAPLGSNSP